MAASGYQQLAELIAKGKPPASILLYGSEFYLRDRCRALLIEKLVPPDMRMWGMSRFSAARGETQAALNQAQSLPMLASRQLVFVDEMEALEDLGEKNRDALLDSIEEYLEKPADFTTLVFEAVKFDKRGRTAKLLFAKTMSVEVELSEDMDERVRLAADLAREFAKEEGVQLGDGAAQDLAEFVAGDLTRLRTEMTKLATYSGVRKKVSREDVSLLVISEKPATVWELGDMIAAGDERSALEFLNRLLRDGEEPIRMVGALVWMYRKLIEATDVKGPVQGWQAAKALGMRPEQAEKAIQNARKITRPQLLKGLQAFREADSRLKGGGGNDPQSVIEFLVSDLMNGGTAPSAASR